MLPKSTIDKLIPILRNDARRALRMKVPGFKRPYYCSFLLRDTHWFNTWASNGSTYRKRSDQTRNVYCDVRVGSHRYDQVTEGGLLDNDDEIESYSHVRVPIDDKCHDGLRIALWRLSEAKVREAIADYNHKTAARVSTVDRNKKYQSFVREKCIKHIRYARPEKVDQERWAKFCKRASKWLSDLPKVSGSWIEFDATQVTKIFTSTENSIVVQHSQVFSFSGSLRHLTKEGSHIEQEFVINAGSLQELPQSMREFQRLVRPKYDQLLDLISARKIHSFSGPVLLAPIPAGLMIHEAIGHRLEGNRLLSSGEGQTFKGQIGKKVVDLPITIRDNPKLKKFQGVRCIGAYDYDDEAVPAQDTLLVEKGVLRNFLTTRAAIEKQSHHSNGHARNAKYERPISRMGVTIMEGENGLEWEELKELLIEEIKRQKRPFGMIIYETSGGETETSSYDFQAFSGEISYATLIYANGKEVPIHGVDFVGTPLQALNNIVAIGSELEVDNGYCGAESGFIPITTISPAILLKTLELQAKEEELVTQYLLPKPRLG